MLQVLRKISLSSIKKRRKIFFALVPALAMLLAFEVYLDLAGYWFSPDEGYVIPGARVVWRMGYGIFRREIVSELNSLGLRGPEPELSPETKSILFLGDSLTFGAGVRDGRDFPSLVDAAVRSGHGHAFVRAVNGGMPGYGIREEIDMARALVPRIAPRLVVLTFCENDLFDILKARDPLNWSRYEHRQRLPLHYFGVIRFAGLAYVRFAHRTGIAARPIKADGVYPLNLRTPDIERGWDEYFSKVDELRRYLDENGARFGFIDFPEIYRICSDPDPLERRFSEYCLQRNVPLLRLRTVFRQKRSAGLPIIVPDGHPNELGHRIAADAIVEWLFDASFAQAQSADS
jgi:lysophospholipase L1-like esterase